MEHKIIADPTILDANIVIIFAQHTVIIVHIIAPPPMATNTSVSFKNKKKMGN
jgi:hypothetical protein